MLSKPCLASLRYTVSAAFEKAGDTRTTSTSPSCDDSFGMLLAAAPCTLEMI
jgi:hypothetical protein